MFLVDLGFEPKLVLLQSPGWIVSFLTLCCVKTLSVSLLYSTISQSGNDHKLGAYYFLC